MWPLTALLALAVALPPRRRPPRRTGACTCSRFGALFAEYGRRFGIPPTFLAVLACRESDCNPRDRKGPAWGLMQITESVRRSVPRERGRGHYERAQLLTPRISVYLCAITLRNIVRTYQAVGVAPAWRSRAYVELVAAGWNAGYSRAAGVGRVLAYLRENKLPLTARAVHAHARAAGATRFLWAFPARLAFWEGIASAYMRTL